MLAKSRNTLGKYGEDAACEYLRHLGHTVLERNWRGGHLEIDIISLAGDGVHFVEVKSLTASEEANPIEKVNQLKQKHITDAALKFLHKLGEDREVFFDVVTVVFDQAGKTVEYYPNAWIPIYM